jgi:hypothetical protein
VTDYLTDDEKSRAVVDYFGRGSFPRANPAAVIAEFGRRKGAELTAYVESILEEFSAIETDWTTHTLATGTHAAISLMRDAHPELSDEALHALGWEFSWSWR